MKGRHKFFYIVTHMAVRFFSDGISRAAAELAYFLLFSLLPLLMFVSALLARLHMSIENIPLLRDMMPLALRELLASYLEQLPQAPSLSLMVTGVILTLYFLSRAVRSMMRTVNTICQVDESRGAFRDVLLSLGMTAGFLVSVVVSFVLVVAGRIILRLLPLVLYLPKPLLYMVHHMGFLAMLAFIFLFLIAFNMVVPNRELKFRDAWPGALFSLVSWVLVSWAFSFYVDHTTRYSMLYGSLAAIIVLMLWLYIVSMLLLMGPQLNHVLSTMREKDN